MTIWKDKDGRAIDIRHLEDNHLRNIVRLILKRESQGFKINQYDQMAMRIGDLIEELYRRGISLSEVKPPAKIGDQGVLFSDPRSRFDSIPEDAKDCSEFDIY